MTLSAAFVLDDTPFVISDLLLTYTDPTVHERDNTFLPESGPVFNIEVPRHQVQGSFRRSSLFLVAWSLHSQEIHS